MMHMHKEKNGFQRAMANVRAPTSTRYIFVVRLSKNEAAAPVCRCAEADAPAAEGPVAAAAASVAMTTVTAVTVLRLPLGRVVVF